MNRLLHPYAENFSFAEAFATSIDLLMTEYVPIPGFRLYHNIPLLGDEVMNRSI
jgi:hypothetical protein